MKLFASIYILFSIFSVHALYLVPNNGEAINPQEKQKKHLPSQGPMARSFNYTKQTNHQLLQFQKHFTPQHSGSFEYFKDLKIDTHFNLSSFDDSFLQSSGHFSNYGLTLSSSVTNKLSIGITYNRSDYESGGLTNISAHSDGLSLFGHYRINDNYGFGAFIFYDALDIERQDGDSWSKGGGLIFTTWHDLGSNFDVSTVTALSKSYIPGSHDSNLTSTARLGKNWDNFTIGLSATYSDSIRSNNGADNGDDSSFWQFGADISWMINKSLVLTVGYEKTEALKHYDDDTLTVDLGWTF